MIYPLSIGYINIRGLTNDKWKYLLSLIRVSSPHSNSTLPNSLSYSNPTSPNSTLALFDILFVSETWFVDQELHQRHPFMVLSSPNVRPRPGGRQHGGLLVLASLGIQRRISSFKIDEYFISVSLGDTNQIFTAVYFPPSLPPNDLEPILKTLPLSTIIVGDINIRYGVSFGDSVSGPPKRKKVIDKYMGRRHLVHIKPVNGISRVDHAFVTSSLAGYVTLSFTDSGVSTDHPLATIKISCPDTHPSLSIPSYYPVSPVSLQRYYIKYLSLDITSTYFGNQYDTSHGFYLSKFFADIVSKSIPQPDDIHGLLNMMDLALLEAIQETAEQVLGSYQVSETQAQDDWLTETLSAPPSLSVPLSNAAAIRLFKRTFRSKRCDSHLVSRNPTIPVVEDAIHFYEDIYQTSTTRTRTQQHAQVEDPFLMGLFNSASIANAIQEYPSGKSPGVDSMDIIILKSLLKHSSSFLTQLTYLFQYCAQTGLTPSRWNESIIHPIPKDSCSARTIDTQRPISLIVLFRRLFERILLKTITTFDEWSPLCHFHPGQAGFRRGFSTLTHALLSHEGSVSGRMTIKIFLDLKQAYDRVPIALVLEKLSPRSSSSTFLSLIDSLFSQCTSRVVVNGHLSRSFSRGRGLFQGSPLSPWLFNVFIDDLVCKLNEIYVPSPKHLTALFFADDIQIQTSSPSHAQHLLNLVSEWLTLNDMEANLTKCGIVSCSPYELFLSGLPIPNVSMYKYLGFPHTMKGIDWTSHVKTVMTRTQRFLSSLAISGLTRQWPEWARLSVYKSFIRPILEYGAPVISQQFDANPNNNNLWIPHQINSWKRRKRKKKTLPSLNVSAPVVHDHSPMPPWKDIEAIQDTALSWIFQCSPFCLPVLRSMTALGTLRHRFHELAARFTYHLEMSHVDSPIHAFILQKDSFTYCCSLHPLRVSYNSLTNRTLFPDTIVPPITTPLCPNSIPFSSNKIPLPSDDLPLSSTNNLLSSVDPPISPSLTTPYLPADNLLSSDSPPRHITTLLSLIDNLSSSNTLLPEKIPLFNNNSLSYNPLLFTEASPSTTDNFTYLTDTLSPGNSPLLSSTPPPNIPSLGTLVLSANTPPPSIVTPLPSIGTPLSSFGTPLSFIDTRLLPIDTPLSPTDTPLSPTDTLTLTLTLSFTDTPLSPTDTLLSTDAFLGLTNPPPSSTDTSANISLYIPATPTVNSNPCSFSDFLRQERLKALCAKSKLASYILPSSRVPSTGLDRVIFITNPDIRQAAIAWRRNVLGIRLRCQICNMPFRRSHIATCFSSFVIPSFPFEEHLSLILPVNEQLNHHYTTMDYLLNNSQYDMFYSLWTLIKASLIPTTASTFIATTNSSINTTITSIFSTEI